MRDRVLFSVLACLTAAGCGDDTAAPTADPPPAAPAFVYVLTSPPEGLPGNAPVLSVLRVTPSGELELADRRAVEYARVIAADPRGRFLFVGGGRPPVCGSPGTGHCHGPASFPGFLRSYSVDSGSGVLSQRDDRTMRFYDSYGFRHYYQIQYLAAGEDGVYAWLNDFWDSSSSFSQFRFDAVGGTLAEAPGLACDPDDAPSWLLPLGPHLLIGGDHDLYCSPADGYDSHSVFGVFAPRPADGSRLHRIAHARLAQRTGVVSLRGALAGGCVAASWSSYPSGAGLTAFAFDPSTGVPSERNTVDGASPTALAATDDLVAVATTSGALETHTLTPTCDLEPGSRLASAATTSLAFHPSGRFLYAVQEGGIRTYARQLDGRWESRGFADGFAGDLVIAPNPTAP